MATTTTNYGFDVPQSSDLVKNGATQIALLGQDLDTFLFRPFTRNCVLNSSFNVWQRGTSFTGGTASTYSADRWVAYRNGTAGSTFSRQVTNDTTNLPFIQYCMRVARDSGNTSTTNIQLIQSLESVNSIPYAGKQVTLSFYARAGANFSAASSNLNILLQTGTGTDQSTATGYTGGANPINTTQAITTTWTRYTMTAVTLASTATEVGMQFYYTPVGTAGANDYFEITGVMLEVGSQASPYTPATPTYATELAACQRYYQLVASGTTKVVANLAAYDTTSVYGVYSNKVSMRAAPTLAITSGTNYFKVWGVGNGGDACDVVGLDNASPEQIRFFVNALITVTQGYSYWLETNNASASLALASEL